jgi:transcription factor IIIB subunit 2
LKLVRFLHKDLPLIDPSLFIRRFCGALEFGDKQIEVEITANRLLKRMRVDWLEQGRRPSSLCGAAILISARYHGFKRTTQ